MIYPMHNDLLSTQHDGQELTPSGIAACSWRVRYTPAKAAKYQNRKAGKHRAEMKLVARAFERVPPGSVLDVPCGGGRISLLLAQLGHHPTAADLSHAMIEVAKKSMQAAPVFIPVHWGDVEALTYPPGSFDSVVCFRLFHHFSTPEIRARAVGELCRVARTWVAISYFSPWSFTSVMRSMKSRWLGRTRHKFYTPLTEVAGYFAPHGFGLVRDFAQLRGIHTLHLALFKREHVCDVNSSV